MIVPPIQSELDLAPAPPERPRSLADDLPVEVLQIIGYLSSDARGEDQAKTARQIAEWLAWEGSDPDRKVRHFISLYQDRFPFVLCATPGRGGGFFVSNTPGDIEHYERTLHATLRSVAIKISKLHANTSRCGFNRQGCGPTVRYSSREHQSR